MLTNAIYGYIYMTHGQKLKHRTCPADQRGHFASQGAWQFRQGCSCDGRPIRYLQTSSVSLYSRGSKDRKYSGARCQNRFYCQAVTEADSQTTKLCKDFKPDFKPDCNPGHRSLSLQRPGAWLKPDTVQNRFNWNIVLIDYHPKDFLWHTDISFRIKRGRMTLQAIS